MGMGNSFALTSGSILLYLFLCKIETAGGDGKNGGGIDTFIVGVKNSAFVDQKLKESWEKSEALVKEKLKLRSVVINKWLQRIEDKAANKELSKTENSMLAMASTQKLLLRAVELQKALDKSVHTEEEDGAEELAKYLVTVTSNFEGAVEAIKAAAKIVNVGNAGEEDVLIKKAEKLRLSARLFASLLLEIHSNPEMADELKTARSENKKTKTFDELIYRQQDFDRYVRALAKVVTQQQGTNIFLQLEKAQQVLNQASTLRMAIGEWVKKKELGEVAEKIELDPSTQHVVREYNDFARKLEHLGDGVHRNLYGQFQLADIDRKISEAQMSRSANGPKKRGRKCRGRKCRRAEENAAENWTKLDSDFWNFIRRLLHDYYQLGLPQMDVVKIRKTINADEEHLFLSVGQIEYDFLKNAVRRWKFQEIADEYTSDGSITKATPLAHTGLVRMAEADRVFFELIQQGWDGESYGREGKRFCLTFVWNFLCQLLGECPKEADMPLNFMTMDKQLERGSVFEHPEFVLPTEKQKDCLPTYHEVWLEFNEDKSSDVELPPIVEYIESTKEIGIQEQAEEVFHSEKGGSPAKGIAAAGNGNGVVRHFKAKLAAFACNKNDHGQQLSHIKSVMIFDQKTIMKVQMGEADGFKVELDTVELVENEHLHLKIIGYEEFKRI